MASTKTFKAAIVHEVGAKNSIVERSLAPLEPGEVAVKVTATAINPVDWKIRDYGWFVESFPTILGSDAAGKIVAVSSDMTGSAAPLKIGDRVMFQGIIGKDDASTFQQYARIPAALVSKTPDNISDEQAAGIHLATMVAVVALYDKSGQGLPAPWDKEHGGDSAGKGKAVVIIGGASSVGQYAIQFARLSGYDRIVTNANPMHCEWLSSLGADVVLDRSKARPEDFHAALDGRPLDFVLDTIAAEETGFLGIDILRAAGAKGAKVVVVLAPTANTMAYSQAHEPKVDVVYVLGVGSLPHLRYLSEATAKHLGGEDGLLATGRIVPNRVMLVDGGLQSVDEALERNKTGISGQKLVIRPWD